MRRSLTADLVALWRAAGQRQPPGERLLDDPFAGPFLAGIHSPLVSGGVGAVRARTLERLGDLPPTRLGPTIQLRHRLIDEHVLQAVEDGAEQVVLLGAGLDARAHRLDHGRPVPYFEVDHPAFSEKKRSLANRLVSERSEQSARVAYCAVDLSRDPLAPALIGAGFDPTQRTVFAWEGVTYYLTRGACDATVAALRALAGAGSTLALDLWSPPKLPAGLGLLPRALPAASLWAIGEPLRFKLPPGTAAAHAWLEGLGLEVVDWYDPIRMREELARRAGRRRWRPTLATRPFLPALAVAVARFGACAAH